MTLIDNPFANIERRFNRLESILEKIAENQVNNESSASRDSLFSRQEAAQYLNISLGTLRTLTVTQQLPVVYIGRNPKYRLEDLENYIESQK